MPDPNAHITNLESDDFIAGQLARAKSAVESDPENGQAQADLAMAQAMAANHVNTNDLLTREFGPLMIGRPRKTKWKSSELLAEQGYVGIYRNA